MSRGGTVKVNQSNPPELGNGGPTGPDGGEAAIALLNAYLGHGRLLLESMERVPLVLRWDGARRRSGLVGGDWVVGIVGWSLLLYAMVRDVEGGLLDEDAPGLLRAAWVRLQREPLGLSGLSSRLAEDPRWQAQALGRWCDDAVERVSARALGPSHLAPAEAVAQFGHSALGRVCLRQSVALAEVSAPSLSTQYRALRRLAMMLARGSPELAPLGASVVPVLRGVMLSSFDRAELSSPGRSISSAGR